MIEVKNLTKRYGEHIAVDDISFTVDKGKIYGFLGPNGAGKSTTMNIITGYLAASKGNVFIDGYDVQNEPEKAKRSVGYLPEIPPLYADMTVREYLILAAELKGIKKSERERHVNVVLDRISLKDVADRLISNLSKGYRQRVGLAQAIIGFPETIILDEPMVGLDPKQIIEIRELIRSLAKNHTVILSSHILAEVKELCDYIIVIANGRLVASDTPENLEKLYEKEEKLQMEIKGEIDKIMEVWDSFDCIKEFKSLKYDDGVYNIEITLTEKIDIREELFFAFAEKKIPIISMGEKKSSLEEIYLDLTQKGGNLNDSNM